MIAIMANPPLMANTACPHPYLEVKRTRNQATIWSGLMVNTANAMDVFKRFYSELTEVLPMVISTVVTRLAL